MKIVINGLHFRKELFGIGNYFKRLLKYIQQFDQVNEYELHINNILSPEKLFEITALNIKIINHNIPFGRLGRIFFEQFIFSRKIKGDILFSPNVTLPYFVKIKLKKIVVIHDLIPFLFNQKYNFIQNQYIKFCLRRSVKLADKIIVVSENTKKDLIEKLQVASEKIEIIYNFLDFTDDFLTGSMPELSDLNYIHTVSTIQPGKNLIRLFRAFSLLLKHFPDLKLIVIGAKGWKYKLIFKEVKQLNLQNNIVFKGFVDDKMLAGYYKYSKGLVYVSLYEGFGIPPLEALYFNCPVVVSNVSSLPEVVGKAGIYVDPYDVSSIYNGMLQLFNKKVLNEKFKFYKFEVNKFNAKTETLKLIKLFL